MTTKCPKCQSPNVETIDVARRVGTVAGGGAGGWAAYVSIPAAAAVGAKVGLRAAGPIGAAAGAAVGTLAGTALAVMAGFGSGAAVGAKAGETIDKNLLKNWKCHSCKHTFSQPK